MSMIHHPWYAFTPAWFAKHQSKLLFGLNTPGLKKLFRKLLGFQKTDVGYTAKILAIYPHAYTVAGSNGNEYISDFRCAPQYAKRLYLSFKWLWQSMHWWDTLLADKYLPEFSFGFSTLTSKPNPDGTPGATTCDGLVGRFSAADETFLVRQAGAGDAANTNNASSFAVELLSGVVTPLWDGIFRAIFLFDTSLLSSTVTIMSAVFSIAPSGDGTDNLAIIPTINVYASNPNTNTAIINSDYGTFGTTPFSSDVLFTSTLANTYTPFTLNADGVAAVIAGGITKLGLRNANYDVAAVTPTWSNNLSSVVSMNWSDNGTLQPKLVITYSLNPAFKNPTIRPACFKPGLAR